MFVIQVYFKVYCLFYCLKSLRKFCCKVCVDLIFVFGIFFTAAVAAVSPEIVAVVVACVAGICKLYS